MQRIFTSLIVVHCVATERTFRSKPKKIKKYSLKKILIFQEMELSNSKTKKFLIFLQKKAVLIFQETKTQKTPTKFFIFQEVIFQA